MTMKQNIIRGKRILLVDDEPSVRGSFRMMLEIDGHTVTEANNGGGAGFVHSGPVRPSGVLARYGTAGGSFRYLARPEQAFFPGFA